MPPKSLDSGHQAPMEVDKSTESTAQQEARATLRAHFLRTLFDLNGESCNILNYERSVHQATFAGWNREGTEVLVKDFKAPNGENIASALLWTSDVLAIQFDKEK